MKRAELEETIDLVYHIREWAQMRANDLADTIFREVSEEFDDMNDEERIAHEVERQSMYDSHELKDEQREFEGTIADCDEVIERMRADLARMGGPAPVTPDRRQRELPHIPRETGKEVSSNGKAKRFATRGSGPTKPRRS